MSIRVRTKWYEWLDKRTELPLLALTLLFVPIVFAGDVFELSDGEQLAVDIAGWALWIVFAVEFFGMLYLSTTRDDYLRNGWWELPVIIITSPLLPFAYLRPLRFLKSAKALKLLKFVKLWGAAGLSAHTAHSFLTKHGLQYVLAGSAALYALSGVLMWAFEQDNALSGIDAPQDALWWGIASLTMLDNAGNEPLTAGGKAVAIAMALLGLALVSVITANIAAYFVHRDEHQARKSFEEIRGQLARIEQQLAALNSGDAEGTE